MKINATGTDQSSRTTILLLTCWGCFTIRKSWQYNVSCFFQGIKRIRNGWLWLPAGLFTIKIDKSAHSGTERADGHRRVIGESRPVCTESVTSSTDQYRLSQSTGCGSYWAERAAARPLFDPCVPRLSLACALLSWVKHYILHYCSFI